MYDDDTPAAAADTSAPSTPAPNEGHDGQYEGGGGNPYSATPDTRASLDALSANRQWSEDFSGANGRDSQRHAVAHKSRLIHDLHSQNEQPVTVTDNRSDALKDLADSANPKLREFASDLTPPPSAADYNFRFEGAENMAPEDFSAMNTEVSEIAFSLGADTRTAKGVVEHLDRFMARNPEAIPPSNPEEIQTAIDKQFGPGNDIVERAKSMVQSIPEGPQRDRVWNTFGRLDLSTTVFLIGKLAGLSRNRANG